MNERNETPDLTPAERAKLARLPREREPDRGLEQRVVDALRQEGLLQTARRPRLISLPLAMAAGILLFVFGWLAGATTGGREQTPDTRGAETTTTEPASEVRVVFWL
jgi:hypothetical protein